MCILLTSKQNFKTNLERIITLTSNWLFIDKVRKFKRGRDFLVEKDYTKCSN